MGIVHPFRRDLDEEYIPDRWTGEHVEKRLMEAFECISDLPPSGIGAGGYRAWPDYPYEIEDLVAQRENILADDPEPLRRRPSANEIERMEECLDWHLRYLANRKENLIMAVTLWILGCVRDDIPRERIASWKGQSAYWVRSRARRGLDCIAYGLIDDGVPVR